MKKITLTFLAVFLSTAFAMAQSQWGVKVGYNLANISDGDTYGGNFGNDANFGDDGDELWRSGVVLGVAGNFVVSESFSILSELNWSQRGKRFQSPTDELENSIRLNYLELPVLAKLGFGETVRGYFTLGPTFNYWTGGNVEVLDREFDIEFTDGAQEFDSGSAQDIQVNNDFVNRFEFGGAVGAGMQVNTEAGDILFDLRYTAGFSDLIEDNEGTFNIREENSDRFRNQIWNFSVIYLLPSIQK
jgi:hypothetical protein